MARKLTGSIRHKGDTWEASVPERRGSTARVYAYFITESDAGEWLARAVAAVVENRDVPPGPSRGDLAPQTFDVSAGRQSWVAAAVEAWRKEYFEEYRRAGAERERDVTSILNRHVLPYWEAALPTPSLHSRDLAKGFLLRLTGSRNAALTVAEAAELAGCSPSRIYRLIEQSSLVTVTGHHSNARFVRIGDVEGVLGITRLRSAYAHAYVQEIVRVWAQIEKFMFERGQIERRFYEDVRVPKIDAAALRRGRRTKPTSVPLEAIWSVASHLHVIHQLVLWLLRICGLRISEAYGIEVGDIIDWGSDTRPGLVVIDKQGGRKFLVRDDAGTVIAADHKDELKTQGSVRVLAVPPALMELVSNIVRIFHTSQLTGEVDLSARLVPGIMTEGTAGQAGFRTALKQAIRLANLELEVDSICFLPHDLRASLITDLAYSEVHELLQRGYAGHSPGSDVHAGYIRANDRPERFHVIAQQLQGQIVEAMDTLMAPTHRFPGFGRGNPAYLRRHEIREHLIEIGWQAEHTLGNDVLLDAEEVALELGCRPSTARRRIRAGSIPSISSGGSGRVPQDQLAEHQRNRHPSLKVVAENHGVDYHRMYRVLNQLGLNPARDNDTGDLSIEPQVAALLLEEVQRVDALHARASCVADAAKRMRLAGSTVRKMLRNGDLPVDHESDATGARFIPNMAIEEYVRQHQR